MSADYARRLIEKRQIREPKDIDLELIANDLEVTIEEDDLEGCDGMLQMVVDPKCGIITVKRSIREPGQKRFIIAHELGHYDPLTRPDLIYQCSPADFSLGNNRVKPEERAANEYAAELLMPEKLFRPRLVNKQPSMDLIKALAAEFQTTLTATLWRFIELTDDRCALILSEDGKIKYPVPSKRFGYRIQRGCPLDTHTYAVDFFENGVLDDQMQSVLASAWIKDSRAIS